MARGPRRNHARDAAAKPGVGMRHRASVEAADEAPRRRKLARERIGGRGEQVLVLNQDRVDLGVISARDPPCGLQRSRRQRPRDAQHDAAFRFRVRGDMDDHRSVGSA
jgi:hypothetical protein